MRTDLPVLRPDDTLAEAAERMAAAGVLLLPIADDQDRALGAVTALDVMAHRATGSAASEQVAVRDAAYRQPVSCEPGTALAQVRAQLCAERQIAALVVEPDGRLLGVLDIFDVLQAESAPRSAGPEPEHVHRVRGDA
jgi:CBS domain-containing protein